MITLLHWRSFSILSLTLIPKLNSGITVSSSKRLQDRKKEHNIFGLSGVFFVLSSAKHINLICIHMHTTYSRMYIHMYVCLYKCNTFVMLPMLCYAQSFWCYNCKYKQTRINPPYAVSATVQSVYTCLSVGLWTATFE